MAFLSRKSKRRSSRRSLIPRSPIAISLMLAGLMLFSVVVSIVASRMGDMSRDSRSQAVDTAACAASAFTRTSNCNEPCGNDTHCSTGLVCYKTGGATSDGVCRLATNYTSATCSPR